MMKYSSPLQIKLLFIALFISNLCFSQIFSEQTGISLTGVKSSTIAWGDYNNDGFLDILLSGESSNGYVSKVYKNNGFGNFEEQTSIKLIGVRLGAVAWGDYNNDGYLDILISGIDSLSSITRIYKNNGNDTFTEQLGLSIDGVSGGKAYWGDYNNDGYLDIMLSGSFASIGTYLTKIYKNNGDGSFCEMKGLIPKISNFSSEWYDYNNDGFLDVMFILSDTLFVYINDGKGLYKEPESCLFISSIDRNAKVKSGDYDNDGYPEFLIFDFDSTKIYKNNGRDTLIEQVGIKIPIVYQGAAAWGDYDGDGYLDIVLSGFKNGNYTSPIIKLYKNNRNNTFTEQTDNNLTKIGYSSLAWGDYDNDKDLDILITGYDSTRIISKIFKNNGTSFNSDPNTPTGLIDSVNMNKVIFNWNKSSDIQTPQNVLSYNIRIGSTHGGFDIVSPMSSETDGKLRVPAIGNASRKTDGYTLNIYKPGKYYWSVQAIDNNFGAGLWAVEDSFEITTQQASGISVSNVLETSLDINWIIGNYSNRALFVAEGSNTFPIPKNNTTYLANSNFRNGSQIDSSGWFCVYNGSGSSASVTGLVQGSQYTVAVIEYFGTPGNEQYNLYSAIKNPITVKTKPLFEEITGLNILGNAVWGDYNNDGYLDFIINEGPIFNGNLKIFKNNGNGTFSKQTDIVLPKIIGQVICWGDYNNDGFLDILVSGTNELVVTVKVIRNNGDNTFTELTSSILDGTRVIGWLDYNNDGNQDILCAGLNLYKNNGNETFTEQTGIFSGINNSTYTILIDFNKDGYMDILTPSKNSITLFQNNGNSTFSILPGISISEFISNYFTICGDYNNDGFMDILITDRYKSLIYTNNGNGSFSELSGTGFVGSMVPGVWIDYNNDGNLDIILNSINSLSIPELKFYNNNGNGTFTEQKNVIVESLSLGIISCGDFDNDFDADIMISRASGGCKILKNNNLTINSIPTIPQNLQEIVSSNSVTFAWDKANDAQTPQGGLMYNIRIGKTPGGSDIVNPMASLTDWKLRKPMVGNVGSINTGFTINGLDSGIYYWSVQAIDNVFNSGKWAEERAFTITKQQAKDIKISEIGYTSFHISWKNGNSEKRLVFVSEANPGMPKPLNNITYFADSIFKQGTQIDTSGWYCVYNGFGSNIYVNGLTPGKRYTVAVLEYFGEIGYELYNTSISNNNPVITATLSYFIERTDITLPGLYDGSVAWCDYNKDGFQDFILTGSTFAKVYRNNGDGTYTDSTIISSNVVYSSVAWGDYNNDGYQDLAIASHFGLKLFENNGGVMFSESLTLYMDLLRNGSIAWGDYNNDSFLDLLVTGGSPNGNFPHSIVFKNNGDNTFSQQFGIQIMNVGVSSVAWGDYNNDGFLDILLAGKNPSAWYVLLVYKNNGDGTFTEQSDITTKGAAYGTVAWGDYNNDGYLDILASGRANLTPRLYTTIYKNNRDGTFSEQTDIILPGVMNGSVAWGDYNNDGLLDIIITGATESSLIISKIYRNNGNNIFTEQTGILTDPLHYSSIAWADFDNDLDLDLLITGSDGSVNVSKIYENVFNIANTPPTIPENTAATVNNDVITLSWEKSNDAQTPQASINYEVRISNYAFENEYNAIKTSNNKLDTYHHLRNTFGETSNFVYFGAAGTKNEDFLLNNLSIGTYYWSVRAIDNTYAPGEWSTEKTFTVQQTRPTFPILEFPENGSADNQLTLDLSWNIVLGAANYNLLVSPSSSFTDTIYFVPDISALNYTINGLLANTSYFWRVNAVNAIGTSNWSDTWTFTTNVTTQIITDKNSLLNIFPNPTNNIININCFEGIESRIGVYSLDGVLLKKETTKQKNTVIDLSDLPLGVYIVKISNAKGVVIRKVTKN